MNHQTLNQNLTCYSAVLIAGLRRILRFFLMSFADMSVLFGFGQSVYHTVMCHQGYRK